MKIQDAGALCLEISLGIVYTNFIAYFDEKLSDISLFCGRFSPTEI
jgi:hypothetical protein